MEENQKALQRKIQIDVDINTKTLQIEIQMDVMRNTRALQRELQRIWREIKKHCKEKFKLM